jgi:hypothetical protein
MEIENPTKDKDIYVVPMKGFGAQDAIIKEYLLLPIHIHDVYIPCLLDYPET